MFPTLRERLGSALDTVVEFSTLGEYRLELPHRPDTAGVPPRRLSRPGLGGRGAPAAEVRAARAVAEGVAGRVPVATPAARALHSRPRRPGAVVPPAQACLASDETPAA